MFSKTKESFEKRYVNNIKVFLKQKKKKKRQFYRELNKHLSEDRK